MHLNDRGRVILLKPLQTNQHSHAFLPTESYVKVLFLWSTDKGIVHKLTHMYIGFDKGRRYIERRRSTMSDDF